MTFNVIIAIAIGYLLGSIPSAYVAGLLKKGVDIREIGGGNMGALNAMRELGLTVGLVVLIADVAKGAIAVLIAKWLGLHLAWIFAAGFAAIIGHNWSIFLGFKGGKGAATTLGVLLALVPREFAICLAIMAVVLVITSNIRLIIVIGLAFLPVLIWLFDNSMMFIWYSVALSLFLIIRSLSSFKEDVSNTEKRKSLIFDREHHFWQARKRK